MEIRLHPLFQRWLEELSETNRDDDIDWFDVFSEAMALIAALEEFGRDLGDPECHRVVSARYDLHALRRTPRTMTTPYAEGPPVLRILFGYVRNSDGAECAVVALGGDKTELGNQWYSANVSTAQDRIDGWCRQNPTYQPIVQRGGR